MSTEFMPSRRIAFERIRHFSYGGVTARLEDGEVFLSDGTNGMWAYPACRGRRITFIRQGDNDFETIIEALEDFFNVHLVSEYEDEFHAIIKTELALAKRKKTRKGQP